MSRIINIPAAPINVNAELVVNHRSIPVDFVPEVVVAVTGQKERGEPAEAVKNSAKLEELLQVLTEQVEMVRADRAQSVLELQRIAVKLAVAVAEAVSRTSMEGNLARINALIEEGAADLLDQELVIFVSPADLKLLESSREVKARKLPVRQDSELSHGDVRIESGEYALESRFDLQLEELRKRLLENLQDATTERRRVAGDHPPVGRFPDRRSG